jgi:hypothetical protein
MHDIMHVEFCLALTAANFTHVIWCCMQLLVLNSPSPPPYRTSHGAYAPLSVYLKWEGLEPSQGVILGRSFLPKLIPPPKTSSKQ